MDERGYVRQIILKGRQLGASTWVGGVCYSGTKLHLGRKAKVLADKLDRSGVLFEMYERFEREAPDLIARPTITAQHRRELAWEGDSHLGVGTANDPQAGRAETLWYVHCSEFAFWEYATEVLQGLLQAVGPRRGEVYIESTANGVGNPFHARWEAAVAHESEWHAIFLPWWIGEDYQTPVSDERRAELLATSDPWERSALDEGFDWGGERHRLEPEQLQFRRDKIANDFDADERIWRQEYPSTPEEAFIATGGAFFDQDRIVELFSSTRNTKADRRSIVAKRLQRAEYGALRIFELPKAGAHYVIGADTATGHEVGRMDDESGGLDFSSADVLKVAQETDQPDGSKLAVPCLEQVASYHGRIVPEIFADGLKLLGAYYACPEEHRDERVPALIGVERNHSSGVTTLRCLRDMGYPNLYRAHMKVAIGDQRPTVNYGFLTDAGSRQMILDTLAARLRERAIEIVSPDTVREMRTFVWQGGKPQAIEGTHDDRVLSLAFALEMARWHRHAAPSVPYVPKVRNTPTGR